MEVAQSPLLHRSVSVFYTSITGEKRPLTDNLMNYFDKNVKIHHVIQGKSHFSPSLEVSSLLTVAGSNLPSLNMNVKIRRRDREKGCL